MRGVINVIVSTKVANMASRLFVQYKALSRFALNNFWNININSYVEHLRFSRYQITFSEHIFYA